jgi:hypothetical protein
VNYRLILFYFSFHIGAFNVGRSDFDSRFSYAYITLFVQDHLRELFSYYGRVSAVRMISCNSMIEMSTTAAASRAVRHLHGGQIDGNIANVNLISQTDFESLAIDCNGASVCAVDGECAAG